ncbi:MAG: M15 family metallopeptidase [Synechococcus sp. ELA057]
MTSMRPWNPIPIADNGEPLLALPPFLLRIEPHPYRRLGAPYGAAGCPFRLRQGVIARLGEAHRQLVSEAPGWRLAIFDAWRPVAVQRFMVAYAIRQECLSRGVDPDREGPERRAVEEAVGRFWAPPSDDPAMPPPHSTGAAVDLTLTDASGGLLDLGGDIDAIGPVSEPDHHAAAALADPIGPEARWHGRRQLLQRVMLAAGFVQHPNEWWHFSHGDQLWAWSLGEPRACYGGWAAAERP